MVLSAREKLLIGVMVALLVFVGLYFGIGGVRGSLHDLESRVAQQEALRQKAMALTGELQRIERPAGRRAPAAGNRSLIGYVEQLSERIGIKDRVQLNLVAQESRSGLQGLDIRVARLSLDELVNFLYTLEDADYRLVVDQLELSPAFRDKDMLRLSMRVLARE